MLSRIYCDYLMPSQLSMYERVVSAAQQAGYTQTSVRGYFDLLCKRQGPLDKVLVHRHDIDTDLRTTRKLFEIEKRHGITSSFYFRLSTLDFALMQEIEDFGSEASYHYEEVATYAKLNKIKDPTTLRSRMAEIRSTFAANFACIEQRLGKKMRTVASHGDFVNRRLKISNVEILADASLRESCGIACEAYDRTFLESFDIYITDRPAPQYYFPMSPVEALRGHARICLLTHPRQVETNWKENTKDNLQRLYEGMVW